MGAEPASFLLPLLVIATFGTGILTVYILILVSHTALRLSIDNPGALLERVESTCTEYSLSKVLQENAASTYRLGCAIEVYFIMGGRASVDDAILRDKPWTR